MLVWPGAFCYPHDMKIGIAGDLHGNTYWTQRVLGLFHESGITTVLQVGDFGVWPGYQGQRFIEKTERTLRHYGISLYVVPGNHEDYDQIEALPVADDGWQYLTDSIALAPRGHRWQWDDTSFVALGGGASVDRAWRLEMERKQNVKVWWPQEAITPQDVDRVVSGGYADVFVGHDAPFCKVIDHAIQGNPQGFAGADLLYAADQRRLMDRAVRGVAPKLVLHGHYHMKVDDAIPVSRDGAMAECIIAGFDKDGMPDSCGTLDTVTGVLERWSV